ncbi:MAG TPA: hypothetical protein VFV19_17100 [Candidatus Polarisedimenticolaceae bacterium]|nr:hypothetical protein [Candidatus Polarisedimenticolaceae bacterium]
MGFARSVQFVVKNGKVDEFKRLLSSEILPLMKKEKGFRLMLVGLDRQSGTSISMWDDRSDAEAFDTKAYPEIIKRLSAVLEGTPIVHMCETVFTLIPDVVLA